MFKLQFQVCQVRSKSRFALRPPGLCDYRMRVTTEAATPPFDDRALMDTTPHGVL